MNSIIGKFNQVKVYIQGELTRQYYAHDIYAIIYPLTNEFSIFGNDTEEVLHYKLAASSINAPFGTALQIVQKLNLRYQIDGGVASDNSYNHNQSNGSNHWHIEHNLGKALLHCTCKDLDNNEIFGDVVYTSSNIIDIYFSKTESGFAYIS